jgi:hypothetical protein
MKPLMLLRGVKFSPHFREISPLAERSRYGQSCGGRVFMSPPSADANHLAN